MADGTGTKLAGRANYQVGEYLFKMNGSAASTHNLEVGDSGKTYIIDSTVARTINLPSPSAGVSYMFIMSDTTADSSIVATAAIIKGGIHAGNSYLTLAGTTIVCELAGAVGDCLSFVSDGTNWYVNGQSAHAAGFSVS